MSTAAATEVAPPRWAPSDFLAGWLDALYGEELADACAEQIESLVAAGRYAEATRILDCLVRPLEGLALAALATNDGWRRPARGRR